MVDMNGPVTTQVTKDEVTEVVNKYIDAGKSATVEIFNKSNKKMHARVSIEKLAYVEPVVEEIIE